MFISRLQADLALVVKEDEVADVIKKLHEEFF